jgi:hypothetical protein
MTCRARAGGQFANTVLEFLDAVAGAFRRTPSTWVPGAMGGFGANHVLRQPLVYLNIPTMQQPEAYIGDA